MQTGFRAEMALGYQQITSLASSTALDVPIGCSLIIITPETQAVRWRDDGTAPTASIGFPLAVGAELQYAVANMPRLRFIEQVAGAVLNICYYGG